MVTHRCLYDVRSGRGCPNEQTLDFDFCNEHLRTPRGKQHILDVLMTRNLTVPSQIESALEAAREVPGQDYQTTALERMVDALDRVLAWEESARKIVDTIPVEDRRFTSRGGDEQLRSEVQVLERAMDRTAKVLSSVSKMALEEKRVSLGRAQTELMIRILMGVISDMRLSNELTDQARAILLQKFRDEANLAARLETQVVKELESSQQIQIPPATGGVTTVSINGTPVYGQNP